MSDASKAVFLSYASQDAEAARGICETLRSAGVEVWFDQSELRGGDAWDAKIRRQIKECALFVPIIWKSRLRACLGETEEARRLFQAAEQLGFSVRDSYWAATISVELL